MAADADSINDLDVIRAGGVPRLFGGVYAPATLGQFLREFSHGHTLQLASVLRAQLVNLVERTDLLPGIRLRAGRAESGKGAATMVTEAIRTARAAGACGKVLVRGD